MATTILAAGTTAATSSDITLAAGESVTLFLTGASGGPMFESAICAVQFKRADNNYTNAYFMEGVTNKNTARFDGPVIFRVSRPAGSASFGVDRA